MTQERDYIAAPVADGLGLKEVILGLAADLHDLRAGTISPADGLARAAVAKQMFNGVRLYLQAVRQMESLARPVNDSTALPPQKEGAKVGADDAAKT